LGDFNAHAPFWDRLRTQVSSNRFLQNIIDSNLVLLNDGRITRIPDVFYHSPSAIDLSLVSPDLAVNTDWEVHDDCLGSDHLPIIITVNFVMHDQTDQRDDKIPKFKYDCADWKKFQSHLEKYNLEEIKHEDIDIFYSNFIEAVLKAANQSIPKCKPHKDGKKVMYGGMNSVKRLF
jgi:hypothetical protein